MTELILAIARAVFVVMFGMNVAVICTWVDRRQGAMIQDRVGPDRAVIWLPTWLARPLVLLPAVLAAGAVMGLAFLDKQSRGDAPVSMARAIFFSQLAVFMTWATAAAIVAHVRKRGAETGLERAVLSFGEPRRIAIAGVFAQLGLLVAMSILSGSHLGDLVAGAAYGGGVLLLAAAMIGGATFTAVCVCSGSFTPRQTGSRRRSKRTSSPSAWTG
jgi:NADH-quinone oxidoreductase subunit H